MGIVLVVAFVIGTLISGAMSWLPGPGTFPAVAAPSLRQGDISLTVAAGLGGYYRQGHWTALRVNVSNAGESLDGALQVRTDATGGLSSTTYRTPLDLPEGARKQVFFYISLENFAQDIRVEVLNEADRVVERSDVSLRLARSSDLLFVVVTESVFGAVDMTSLTPGTGNAHQTTWAVDHIPPSAEALAGLDVLLFHDVDTGSLTTEQVTAIRRWVAGGGHLIVTGGDAWQRTTAGLLDMLPMIPRGTVQAESLVPLADFLRRAPGPLDESLTVTDNEPRPGTRVLLDLYGVPLLVRHSVGTGTVDFVAADPNTEPLRSWAGKADLWYALTATTGQRPSWSRGFSDWSLGREATLTTSSTVLPTFFQLCGFLVLYIVLIGPVNYLVLKQFNRRELAWITIPVLIVVFSVLAYQVGFNLRGNTPTVNRLSVVEVWPGEDDAQVSALVGIQSPRRSDYDIAVERGYTLRTLPTVGTGLNAPTTINESTRYSVDGLPIDAGTIASFVVEGTAPAPRLDANATWWFSADGAPQITGSITNTTGTLLEDAVVLVKGESRWLGTLAPGETRSFDMVIGPQDPGPLTAGNALYDQPTYWSNPWTGGSRPGWCFTHSGLALTVPDVMRGEPFECDTGRVTAREQEIRRRYRLLASLIVDRDLSGGREMDVFLFAWSKDGLVEVDLVDRAQNVEDTTLYIFKLPAGVAAQDERVTVPSGLTTWTVAAKDDPDALLEVSPNGFQIANEATAAFQFVPMPAARLDEVDELLVSFQGQGPLAVELWNWRTSSWDVIPLNPADVVTSLSRPAAYVGPENAVNVRVGSTDPTAFNQVDYVKVAYRGVLAAQQAIPVSSEQGR